MDKALKHKRIAIAGARRFQELSAIIAKQGAEALLRPMMGSVSNDSPDLAEVIERVSTLGSDWFVLVTGVGSRALLTKADALGLGQDLRRDLSQAQLAVRGYKVLPVLKELSLEPTVYASEGTVESLRRALEPFDFSNQRVTVQLHGERMAELTDWLLAKGAKVTEIPLYFYEEPAEEIVWQLLYEVLSKDVDAVAFTSNTQVRFFFEAAKRLGAGDFLRKAFNDHVIALSVGSMTSAALETYGVTRVLSPRHERMGAMVMALAEYYRSSRTGVQRALASVKEPAAMSALPVVLTGLKSVVVLGGGRVAERKVNALINARLKPLLISPQLTPGLEALKSQDKLEHVEKYYEAEDVKNADLVIAATNNKAVNQAIAEDAMRQGCLCNVVDQAELGNVHMLAAVRQGDVLLTVSSGGKSPALTSYIKAQLEASFGEIYADVLEVLGAQREAVKALSKEQRQALIERLLCEPKESFEHLLDQYKGVFS